VIGGKYTNSTVKKFVGLSISCTHLQSYYPPKYKTLFIAFCFKYYRVFLLTNHDYYFLSPFDHFEASDVFEAGSKTDSSLNPYHHDQVLLVQIRENTL